MINTCKFDCAQIHFKFSAIHHYFHLKWTNPQSNITYILLTQQSVYVNPHALILTFSVQKRSHFHFNNYRSQQPSTLPSVFAFFTHKNTNLMWQALIYTAHTPADIFHFSTSHSDKTSTVSHQHLTASFPDPIHLICKQADWQGLLLLLLHLLLLFTTCMHN